MSGTEKSTVDKLIELSRWVDDAPENAHRNPEALTWHRTAKVAEESGEVIEAMIGYTGGNPRKGHSKVALHVIEELLDVAVAALGAVEHLREHDGRSMVLLAEKIHRVHARAGLG